MSCAEPKRQARSLDLDNIGTAREYIQARIKIMPPTTLPTGCWEWQMNKLHGGHGQGKFRGYPVKAHRLSYAAYRGEPGDMMVLHECDNAPCCNPEHLFLGTRADNNRDAHKKGRYARRQEKLTREQYDEIVRRIGEGEALIPLGLSMGVAAFHLTEITKGRHWACDEYGEGRGVVLVENGRESFTRSAQIGKYRGVIETKGRWRAQVQRDGKIHHFGLYDTPEEARDARALGIAALKAIP